MNGQAPRRRLAAAVLAAGVFGVGSAGEGSAQASAEVTAIATVTMPPVEITADDLDFGLLELGEEKEVLPIPSEEARGHFEIHNVAHMGDRVNVRFRDGNGNTLHNFVLRHQSGQGASIPVKFDSRHAHGCWWPHNDPAGGACFADTWDPREEGVIVVPSDRPGRGTRVVLDVYLGGIADPGTDHPAGVYEGRIQIVVTATHN